LRIGKFAPGKVFTEDRKKDAYADFTMPFTSVVLRMNRNSCSSVAEYFVINIYPFIFASGKSKQIDNKSKMVSTEG
jgi:hypothetical protein